MSKISIVPFEQNMLSNYQDFAYKNWGKNCYQASENYLNWLYKENPSPNKTKEDFMVAIKDDKIIGAIHRMHIPWIIDGVESETPAIHNLLVEEKYRQGHGIFLITASLRGADHILIPGVSPPLSKAYEKFGSQEMSVGWYRKILRPFSGALSLLKNRIGLPEKQFQLDNFIHKESRIISTSNPSDKLISKLSTSLQANKNSAAKPNWNEQFLKWRFFHPLGPKSILIYKESKSTFDFLIFSIGIRKVLKTARLIESVAVDQRSFNELLNQSESLLKRNGLELLLIYTASEITKGYLQNYDIKNLASKTKSYIYHQDKSKPFKDYSY